MQYQAAYRQRWRRSVTKKGLSKGQYLGFGILGLVLAKWDVVSAWELSMDDNRSLASLASIVELTAPFRSETLFQQKDVFIAGLDNTNIFRIPALIATPNDTLLAFCEARERDDCDPLDLVLKRSVRSEKNLQGVNGVCWPNDRKWLPMQVVVPGDGEAISNPCPLLDRTTGMVWLCCRMAKGGLAVNLKEFIGPLLILCSADEGATWTTPTDISVQVGYFVPGPGVGTQMRSGRLIVPGYDQKSSMVIFSDDHGKTWQPGHPVGQHSNESQAVELEDGLLMMNMRISGCRYVALSRDGGATWFKEYRDEALPDPSCMGAIVRYSSQAAGGKSRLLFANPATPGSRTQLTVKLSYDEGRTWPIAKMIQAGPAAYSSLAVLPDGTIGLLYETGDSHPYERIRFARFSLEWLTEGQDRIWPSILPLELPLDWNFKIDSEDVGLRDRWFVKAVDRSWHRIKVDSPWTKQGYEYHGTAWYHLSFTVPSSLPEGVRLMLLFGAIDGYAQVYLDGVKIAEEKVGPLVMSQRPFFVSLPKNASPGQTCDLMVRVAKDSGNGGLWKPVCLVERD